MGHRIGHGHLGGFSAVRNKSMVDRSFTTKAPIGGGSFASSRSSGWDRTAVVSIPQPRQPVREPREMPRPRLLCHRWPLRDLLRKGRETLDEWRRDGIPTTVLNQVGYRANVFVAAHGLPYTDIEDVSSDLLLKVWKAIPRFEEGTVQVTTFTRGVLDLEYMEMLRKLYTRRGHGHHPVQLEDPNQVRSRDGDEQIEQIDCRDLVASQIASLPEPLRDIAVRLKTKRPREIADDLGVHPGTVYRRIERIRALLDETK